MTISGTVGSNGSGLHPCSTFGGAFGGGYWEQYVSNTLPFKINADGTTTIDYEGGQYTEYQYEGGGGATFWLKKLGSITTAPCGEEDAEAWDLWVANRDGDDLQEDDISGDVLIDTVDYPALTISHDGTGTPTSVNCVVGANSIGISFVGGDYGGTSCTLDIHTRAAHVCQCINSIGRGLSATTSIPDVVFGDSGAGYCNPLVGGNQDLTVGDFDVEYNKEGYYAWKPSIRVYSDGGDIQDSVDNYNPAINNYVPLPNQNYSYWVYLLSPYFDICKCHEQVVNSGDYCPDTHSYTFYNESDPTPCVDAFPGSNCYEHSFSCVIT